MRASWRFRTTMAPGLAAAYAALRERDLAQGSLARAVADTGIDFGGKVVLDLAAGPGCWDVALRRAGASRVIWMDADPWMLGHAVGLHSELGVTVEHILARMEAIPLAKESVDVVVFLDAIYHAANEATVCREVSRVLPNGGILWLTTRSAGRLLRERRPWWKKLFLWLSPWLALVLGRKVLPTPFVLLWRLRAHMRGAGLRVMRCRRVGQALYEFLAIKDRTDSDAL